MEKEVNNMSKSIEQRIGRPNGIRNLASGGFIFKDSNLPVRKPERVFLEQGQFVPIKTEPFSNNENKTPNA